MTNNMYPPLLTEAPSRDSFGEMVKNKIIITNRYDQMNKLFQFFEKVNQHKHIIVQLYYQSNV